MMRFLSRVEILKDEAYSLGISDPYAWHQSLWRSFPGHDGEKRSFLFRTDEKECVFIVHMLSEIEPAPTSWGVFRTKKVGEKFLTHLQYRFQLRANPTKRLARGDGKGKRVGIYGKEELDEWFSRKADRAGFIAENVSVSPPASDYFIKNGRKNKLNRVDFQGILEVVDQEKFKKAFNSGIGSAKSLGYGMLVLQPISV